MEKEQSNQQKRKVMHLRIWVSGLIAASVFTLFMLILEDEWPLVDALINFIVIYGVWNLIHYVMLRKHFKALK